jgi:hypothetical protein
MKMALVHAFVAGGLIGTGATLAWLGGVWLWVWRERMTIPRA